MIVDLDDLRDAKPHDLRRLARWLGVPVYRRGTLYEYRERESLARSVYDRIQRNRIKGARP